METHSILEYIHIGAMNWHLVQLHFGVTAGGDSGVLMAIQDLQSCIEKAGLKVSYRAGFKLWQLLDELGKLKPSDTVPNHLVECISTEARGLEKTLVAEAQGRVVFVVTEKRIDVDRLINKPSTLLSPNVWGSLPRISAVDFIYACNAIAYELSTAGAFHLLRCLEGTIRHYYLCVIKKDRLHANDRMWGPMVRQMREKKRDRPPDELLDTLDRIRVNFRNPTNHPDKLYDSDEVQDLFGLCVDALNRIVKSKLWVMPSDSADNAFVASES